jgi:hypothetical protein
MIMVSVAGEVARVPIKTKSVFQGPEREDGYRVLITSTKKVC